MQLVDDRRLANARIAGNQNEFWTASRDDAIEGRQQRVDFGCSPVQSFGNQQPVRPVVLTRPELIDPSVRFPLFETALKIPLQAHCSLVSLFGGFGEQLHDDGRNRKWNIWRPLSGRQWL